MNHRRKHPHSMPVAVYYGEEPPRTPKADSEPFWRSRELLVPRLLLRLRPLPKSSRWYADVNGVTVCERDGSYLSRQTARDVANALRLHADLAVVFRTDMVWDTPVRHHPMPTDPQPRRLRPRRALAAVLGEELDPDPDKVIS